MVNRRGVTKLGCLFTILVIVAIAYFGVDFGEQFWKYYQYKDSMKQELRFRSDQPDDQIRAHMKLVADSLGLPDDAGQVTITRDPQSRSIAMDSHYDVTVTVPGYQRTLHFDPHAADSY